MLIPFLHPTNKWSIAKLSIFRKNDGQRIYLYRFDSFLELSLPRDLLLEFDKWGGVRVQLEWEE